MAKYCCEDFAYAARKYIGYYDDGWDFCDMESIIDTIPDKNNIVLQYYDGNVYATTTIKFCPFCGTKLDNIKE